MMDEMYGLRTTANYYEQTPAMVPIFGSGQMFSTSSTALSDVPSVQTSCTTTIRSEEEEISTANRAKIISHPLYPKLLQSYIACQKVGAPQDVANLFDEIFRENDPFGRSVCSSCLGDDDPELDEFMESYCEVLMKYKSDLATPFNQATTFLNNIETQLSNLGNSTSRSCFPDEVAGHSEEDSSTGLVEVQESNRTSEDRELKDKLLAKYSKYISSLKHKFSNKKKKKGKLPREARQILLDWWNIHCKWPYPTEADKIALAETTGLDQKQINNWFINQRKRHWKPSENMQIAVMDNLCGSFFMNN